MQARIRIIKGGVRPNRNSLPDQSEKIDRQLDREMANTVKSWVAEWEERNSLVKAAAFSLVRSLKRAGKNSPQPFAV